MSFAFDNKKEPPQVPEQLYTYTIDQSVFDHIIVDQYSIELEKRGAVGQRYADIFFIDEGLLYLYFYPSFAVASAYDSPDDKKIIEKELIEKAKYKPEERVEAPPNVTGIVHINTVEAVIDRNRRTGNKYIPHLKSTIQGGFSHYKVSKYNSFDLSRSTKNFTYLEINELAEICFHFPFDQMNFQRPAHTLIYKIQRTIEHNNFKKILKAKQKARLAADGLITLPVTETGLAIEADKYAEEESIGFYAENQWKEIYKDKKMLANYIMKTVYFASGLEPLTTQDPREHPDDFKLIERAILLAKKYAITLNFDYIPFHTQKLLEKKDLEVMRITMLFSPPITDALPALGVALQKNRYEIAEILFKAGASPSSVLKSIFRKIPETSLTKENIQWLIDHGADINELQKELIEYIKKGDTTRLQNLHVFKTDFPEIYEKLTSAPEFKSFNKHEKLYVELKAQDYDIAKIILDNFPAMSVELVLSTQKSLIKFRQALENQDLTELKKIQVSVSSDIFTFFLNFKHDTHEEALISILKNGALEIYNWLTENNIFSSTEKIKAIIKTFVEEKEFKVLRFLYEQFPPPINELVLDKICGKNFFAKKPKDKDFKSYIIDYLIFSRIAQIVPILKLFPDLLEEKQIILHLRDKFLAPLKTPPLYYSFDTHVQYFLDCIPKEIFDKQILNFQDPATGETPLMLASQLKNSKENIVGKLISLGADPTIVCQSEHKEERKTAIDFAVESLPYNDIVQMIKNNKDSYLDASIKYKVYLSYVVVIEDLSSTDPSLQVEFKQATLELKDTIEKYKHSEEKIIAEAQKFIVLNENINFLYKLSGGNDLTLSLCKNIYFNYSINRFDEAAKKLTILAESIKAEILLNQKSSKNHQNTLFKNATQEDPRIKQIDEIIKSNKPSSSCTII